MINANTIISELQNLNYQFLVNNKNGLKVDNKNYIFKTGKIPILLSAPHAVKQCRESQVKPSDYLTGALAIYLAEKCDCSYFVRVFNDNDDPNFPLGTTLLEIENEYLRTLKKFIQEYNIFLMIDIHGCVNSKKYDCSLWHDDYNTCETQVVKIFENNFNCYDLTIDNGTEYLGGQVTRQCALITNSFQIEIKRRIRTLKLENYYLLKSFIDSMEKSIYETYDYSMKLEKVRRDRR
ncbi:MAG: hypothetical protein J6J17_01095 [Bacilli bacterium]|nr:hypothetical protein [Bacilli bacterium]